MSREKKKKSTRQKVYFTLELLFLVLFLMALCYLAKLAWNYYQGDQIYKESLSDYVVEPRDKVGVTNTKKGDFIDLGLKVDLDRLKAENAEAIGWLYIPNTTISYPLMQTDNNDYYLKHTYNRADSNFGSIFLAAENGAAFEDTHSIIYGHNTKNGSMFGGLKKYKSADYLAAHPTFYILQEDQVLEYQIVSAFMAEITDAVYQLSFGNEDDYRSWLKDMVDLSEVPCSAPSLTGTEKTVTLSTCTSRRKTERFVVNGILVHTYDGVT